MAMKNITNNNSIKNAAPYTCRPGRTAYLATPLGISFQGIWHTLFLTNYKQ